MSTRHSHTRRHCSKGVTGTQSKRTGRLSASYARSSSSSASILVHEREKLLELTVQRSSLRSLLINFQTEFEAKALFLRLVCFIFISLPLRRDRGWGFGCLSALRMLEPYSKITARLLQCALLAYPKARFSVFNFFSFFPPLSVKSLGVSLLGVFTKEHES